MKYLWPLILMSCGRVFVVGDQTLHDAGEPYDAGQTRDAGEARDSGQTLERCGTVTCGAGFECCNASCGICTAPGFACSQLACSKLDGGSRPDGGSCPPFLCTSSCLSGYVLEDGCETCHCQTPPDGGTEPCGKGKCGPGYFCCNDSCGICSPAGGACATAACSRVDGGNPGGPKCGPVTCATGQECCNESCGACVEPGGVCTQQICQPADAGLSSM